MSSALPHISLTNSIAYYLYRYVCSLLLFLETHAHKCVWQMRVYMYECMWNSKSLVHPPPLVHSKNHLATVFVWQIYKNNWIFVARKRKISNKCHKIHIECFISLLFPLAIPYLTHKILHTNFFIYAYLKRFWNLRLFKTTIYNVGLLNLFLHWLIWK